MCGLAGFVAKHNSGSRDGLESIGIQMALAIQHRGPDSEGVWADSTIGLCIAHRRLSILDLSKAGHQPMFSSTGRYVIAFNGEIYNHLSLRKELDGLDSRYSSLSTNNGWRGHSDTETLLVGFETWGIEETLKRAIGMFAIALWDRKERVLTLARDRIGEKPLYYGFQNDVFLFGSELKALAVHPQFQGDIDRDVICLYLRHCYIPAPYSIYKDIKKLLPGTYLQIPFGQNVNSFHAATSPKAYWSLMKATSQGLAAPFAGTDADAISTLDSQLRKSIALQMVADVPLGAFLSGGVDSSTVVALMQAQSVRPVNTFSIGFDEQDFNEAKYAKAVADHLGSDHNELYVSSAQAMQVIPMLGRMYDEPFADSSQIPTFLISQMTRKHVKVSLSGDAGDELFCGYSRYALADIWGRISKFPFPARRIAGRLIKSVSPTTWDAISRPLANILAMPTNMSEKLERFASRLVNVDGVNELYFSLVSEVEKSEEVVIGTKEPSTWLTNTGLDLALPDAKLHMMVMDLMTYLPDDILVKVDRAAMANSLETRVPFLDHRVVELALALPMSMKIRFGESKWILRQVLYQYVPRQLIDRPKAGFSIPLGSWLRGSLREWAEMLLDEHRLQQDGYFNAKYVRDKWLSHIKGNRNNNTFLWNILMFQVWLQEQRGWG